MAEMQPPGEIMPLWMLGMYEWGGRVRDTSSRLHELLAASYPIWGWQEAEEVAEELHEACLSVFPFHGPQARSLGRIVEAWANDVHRAASLEACVRALTEEMRPFVNDWWVACMGLFHGWPAQDYRRACIRGGALRHFYENPYFPHVVVPQQGAVTTITPTHYGAGAGGAWDAALRPAGLSNILQYLNACERNFVFGIVYMSMTEGWQDRYETMIRVLVMMVRWRVEGNMDTMHPNVMGMQWDLSWVTSGMLRTWPGQAMPQPAGWAHNLDN